jgi:hypothetical protein
MLFLHPLNIPILIFGLVSSFFNPMMKKIKLPIIIFLVVFFILLTNKTSKGEYMVAAYCILFAAGGVSLEKYICSQLRSLTLSFYLLLLLVSAIVLIPATLPALSIENYISYAKFLGIPAASSEGKEMAELPQFYADMFGWEKKAVDVAGVFNKLSESEKKRCAIFASNYGRCGAIDFYGEKYVLPKSIGNHNNYWL